MNIFNEFKKELGYINVTNQYIELSQRLIKDKYNDTLTDKNKIKEFAHCYNLNITEIHNHLETQIAQNYIISINSILTKFLAEFSELHGSPMKKADKKPDKVTPIEWALQHVYSNGTIPDNVKFVSYICDYYRLVRNHIIHDNTSKKRYSYSEMFDKLKPHLLGTFLCRPNQRKNISFQ